MGILLIAHYESREIDAAHGVFPANISSGDQTFQSRAASRCRGL